VSGPLPDRFDVAWLPSFFIPERDVDAAFSRLNELQRPAGTG